MYHWYEKYDARRILSKHTELLIIIIGIIYWLIYGYICGSIYNFVYLSFYWMLWDIIRALILLNWIQCVYVLKCLCMIMKRNNTQIVFYNTAAIFYQRFFGHDWKPKYGTSSRKELPMWNACIRAFLFSKKFLYNTEILIEIMESLHWNSFQKQKISRGEFHMEIFSKKLSFREIPKSDLCFRKNKMNSNFDFSLFFKTQMFVWNFIIRWNLLCFFVFKLKSL